MLPCLVVTHGIRTRIQTICRTTKLPHTGLIKVAREFVPLLHLLSMDILNRVYCLHDTTSIMDTGVATTICERLRQWYTYADTTDASGRFYVLCSSLYLHMDALQVRMSTCRTSRNQMFEPIQTLLSDRLHQTIWHCTELGLAEMREADRSSLTIGARQFFTVWKKLQWTGPVDCAQLDIIESHRQDIIRQEPSKRMPDYTQNVLIDRIKHQASENPEKLTRDAKTTSPGTTPNRPRALVGLTNPSQTTCYMNATLQCLCSIPELITYFSKEKKESSASKPVAQAFGQIVRKIINGTDNTIENTAQLTELLPVISTEFVFPLKQQDCQLFLIGLFAQLSADTRHRFEGQETNVIICTSCGSERQINPQSFTTLKLPIPELPTTLSDLLQTYTARQSSSEDTVTVCTKCGTAQQHDKQASVTQWPPVLIVNLMRYTFDKVSKHSKKTTTDVVCPDILTIPDHRYRLYAVTNHKGNQMNAGHYTAHCNIRDRWYTFDDDRPIIECDLATVTGPSTYMLYYQRIA